jgi:hypothetical protein
MPKRRTPESIAAELAVPERLLLFCVAFRSDWVKAGITPATATNMMVRGLIARAQGSYRLTHEGRAVLAVLLTTRTSSHQRRHT